MSERTPATCVRCRVTGPRRGVSWPEGYVCRRCYQQATRRHGPCPRCGQPRLLPGLDEDSQPICRSCAGIEQDFTCARCGQEDEPHRRGACARCCLRDDFTALLDDNHGHVPRRLQTFLTAVCEQAHPRSALIWMRNPDVRRILSGLATGDLALSHETFDHDPARRTASHLRELLMRHDALPQQDRTLLLFTAWLEATLAGYSPPARALLQRFATWHHLRRLRRAAGEGTLKPTASNAARQSITTAGQLLTFLEADGIEFSSMSQAHLDAWLATGPSTRYSARTFVLWAGRAGHLPALTFPHRAARSTPVLSQNARLALVHRSLTDTAQPPAYRLAAVLLLLYAQPVTRISRLRLDDIVTTPGATALRLGNEPAVLPAPVADLLTEHLSSRPNQNTAANTDSPWLFPGYRPGQPLHHSYLMTQIRDAGVHLLGARNSALRQLVLDMPPAVAAEALGYSPQVAEAHARDAGATWVTYASYRNQQPRRRVE
ncbi:hypothetical protein CLV35_1662 [Motilibacter peucedani]|uniref:Site-specific recombinase XerD n=1 Tax=Motilibacter peucedani TaxID=598650 RepID=A0A420XT05_9ACTN|nr:hypothetical protein [Motilibacter peucedani]RKS77957.1 hypothetical protein CLV35_1662 [Motilibacter peucedani]